MTNLAQPLPVTLTPRQAEILRSYRDLFDGAGDVMDLEMFKQDFGRREIPHVFVHVTPTGFANHQFGLYLAPAGFRGLPAGLTDIGDYHSATIRPDATILDGHPRLYARDHARHLAAVA